MKIIYSSDENCDEKLFYFKQRGYGNTPAILSTDITCLEDIELKCVRKIVKVLYRVPPINYKKSYAVIRVRE
jgi:hypothetical protein